MLGVNNGIDVPYQHITNSIFRLQCKNWFSNLEEPQVSGEGERGPHLLIDIHEIHWQGEIPSSNGILFPSKFS